MNENKQSSSTTKKRRKILPSSSIMENEEDNDAEIEERKRASRPRYYDLQDRNISFTGAGNQQPHGNNSGNSEDQNRPRQRRKICSNASNVGLGRLKKSDSDPSSTSDDHNDGSEEGTFSSSSDHEDRHPDRDRTLSSRQGTIGGAAAAASVGRTSGGTGNQSNHNDRAVAQSHRSDCHHHHRRQRSHGHGRTTTSSTSQSTSNSHKYDPPLILSIEEAQKRIKRLSHEELIVASRRALQLHLQHQFLKQTKANTEAAAAASSVAASSSLSEHKKCGAAAALSSSRSSLDKPSDEEEDQMNKKISSSELQKQTQAGWKIDSSNPSKMESSATKYTHDEEPVPTVEQLEIQARLQEKALYVAQENPSLAQALLHFAAIASGMTQSPFYNPNFVQQAAASLMIGQPKMSAAANSADATGTDQVPQTVSAKVRPEDILASAMAVAAAGSGSDQAGDSNGSHGEGSGGSGSNDQKTTSGALSSLSSSVMYRSKEETTSSSSGDDHNYEKKKEHQINKKRRTTSDVPSDTCYNSNEGRLSSLSSSNDNANNGAAAAQDSKLSPHDAGKVQTFIDASGGASVPMSGLSASNSDPSGSTGSSNDKKPSAIKNESHGHAEEGSADNGHNRHKHRTSNLEGHLNRQGRKIAFKEMQQQGGAKDQRINKEEYGKNDLLGEESVSSGVTSEDGGVSSSLSGSTNTNDKQPSVSSDQAVCSRSSGSSGQQQLNQDHNRRNHSSSHTGLSPLQQGVAFDLTSRGKRKQEKLISSTEQQLLKDRYKFEWEQMLSERPESSDVHGITKWLLRLFDLATLSQAASEAGIAVTNSTRSSSNEGDGDNLEDEEPGARNSVGGRQPKKRVANDSNYEASSVAAKGHSHRLELENPNSSSTHPHEKASKKRVKTSRDGQ